MPTDTHTHAHRYLWQRIDISLASSYLLSTESLEGLGFLAVARLEGLTQRNHTCLLHALQLLKIALNKLLMKGYLLLVLLLNVNKLLLLSLVLRTCRQIGLVCACTGESKVEKEVKKAIILTTNSA
jgi:hypothetical protein